MKPFNLQQTKAGAPVCTRDGHEVRIICFDAKGTDCRPIIALITNTYSNGNKREYLQSFTKKGELYKGEINRLDLMMVDTKYEYKKGYVNVYKSSFFASTKGVNAHRICKTKKEAKEFAKYEESFLTTLEIKYKYPKNIPVLTRNVSGA